MVNVHPDCTASIAFDGDCWVLDNEETIEAEYLKGEWTKVVIEADN